MKRKTAKEILAESFLELAEIKRVDKITIKDITDRSGYSVATFYLQFRDKFDLIAWEETASSSKIMEKIGVNGYEWRNTLLDGARRFEKRKKYLANLFLHPSGLDSFIRYKTELNYRLLKKCVERGSGRPIDTITDMCVWIYCAGSVCLTCDWVLEKYKASAEQLAETYEKAVPELLRPSLYQ